MSGGSESPILSSVKFTLKGWCFLSGFFGYLCFSAFVLLKMWFMKVFALMHRSLFMFPFASVLSCTVVCYDWDGQNSPCVTLTHNPGSKATGLFLEYTRWFTFTLTEELSQLFDTFHNQNSEYHYLVVKGQEFKDELLKCKERLVPEQQTRVPAAAGGEAAAVGVSTVQLQREAWAEWKSGFQHDTEGRQVASWPYSTGEALVGLKMASISSWAQSYKKAASQSYCVFITWTLPKSSVSLPPPGFKTVGSGVKIEE